MEALPARFADESRNSAFIATQHPVNFLLARTAFMPRSAFVPRFVHSHPAHFRQENFPLESVLFARTPANPLIL